MLSVAREHAAIGAAPAIAWSGTLAELSGGAAFDEDPRTWATAGWAALEQACRVLNPRPGNLLIRPHARHVISDVPSCRRLLDSEFGRQLGLGLVYDPASMCAASMLAPGQIEDHLRRMYEAIELFPTAAVGESGGLAAVVVGTPTTSGRAANPSDIDPIGNLCLSLARQHIPPHIPTLIPA